MGVPTKPPMFRTLDYGALVRNAWGDEWHARDVFYEFSNGRQFKDSGGRGAFYNVNLNGITQETLDSSSFVYPYLLQETGGRLLQE